MATDPNLHEDIGKLAEEIHGLSERFSAKEVLAQKANELAEEASVLSHTARNLFIAMALVVLLLAAGGGWVGWQLYQVTSCQARFNKATEERSDLLTEYTVSRDAAMERLVQARGLPNDQDIIDARDAWLRANWLLKTARDLNPVPQYEDFCKPVFGVGDPKVPAAKAPGPVPSPLPTSASTPPSP